MAQRGGGVGGGGGPRELPPDGCYSLCEERGAGGRGAGRRWTGVGGSGPWECAEGSREAGGHRGTVGPMRRFFLSPTGLRSDQRCTVLDPRRTRFLRDDQLCGLLSALRDVLAQLSVIARPAASSPSWCRADWALGTRSPDLCR